MKNKILLRADDLGYSEAVNYGIEKSVKAGLINNVGVMLNMEAALHGINLIKDEDVAFGQHTNFCNGKPLSDSELIPSLTTSEGYFKASKTYRESPTDFVVFEEALIEIEAQYKQFKLFFGKEPDYLEGHAIASPTFFKALEYFAEEQGLTYSGLPSNFGKNISDATEPSLMVNNTKVYMFMESMNKNYDPYQTFDKMVNNRHADGVDMMVFHPGYLDNYILNNSSLLIPRVLEVDMLASERLKDTLEENKLTLVKYKDL